MFDQNGTYRPGLGRPIPVEADPDGDLRWAFGEEFYRRSKWLPAGFMWVYYAVIGWKRLRRALIGRPRPRPPRRP
jgi:hypothetical protein